MKKATNIIIFQPLKLYISIISHLQNQKEDKRDSEDHEIAVNVIYE